MILDNGLRIFKWTLVTVIGIYFLSLVTFSVMNLGTDKAIASVPAMMKCEGSKAYLFTRSQGGKVVKTRVTDFDASTCGNSR